MLGYRKFLLGLVFIVGGMVLLGLSLFMDKTGSVIGALAGAFVSLSTGLGVIIWGNAQEWKSKNAKE